MIAIAQHQGAEIAMLHGRSFLRRLIRVGITQVAILGNDEKTQAVAFIEQEGRDRIVGQANGVAAHFLQPLKAPREQPIGYRHADAGVVLMHVYALELEVFAVDEESPLGVKAHVTHAEICRHLVNHPAGHADGAAQPVEVGTIR